MPSKPVFSDADKKVIRKRLGELCEECWIAQGYKKISIKNLCDQAAISIGTFYTLYPAKEDLFLETIERIQKRLRENFLDSNRRNQTKEGFAQSMKELFREYDSKYQALLKKQWELSMKIDELKNSNKTDLEEMKQ